MRLTSTRRSGLDRDIGIKTAIAVAMKCAFTLEKHGDEVAFGRNACDLHTNFRHLLRHLLKQGLLPNKLSSCRYIASESVCSSHDSFNPLEPLTWTEKCVLGNCSSCSGFSIACPPEKEGVAVSLAQWENKFCELKQRKIHSLFSTNIKLKDVVSKFNLEVKKMTGHVYRAARTWETYKV